VLYQVRPRNVHRQCVSPSRTEVQLLSQRPAGSAFSKATFACGTHKRSSISGTGYPMKVHVCANHQRVTIATVEDACNQSFHVLFRGILSAFLALLNPFQVIKSLSNILFSRRGATKPTSGKEIRYRQHRAQTRSQFHQSMTSLACLLYMWRQWRRKRQESKYHRDQPIVTRKSLLKLDVATGPRRTTSRHSSNNSYPRGRCSP
jgi:hypothetical protein